MISEVKIISLALAVFTPLVWMISLLLDGFKGQRSKRFLLLIMLAGVLVYSMTYAKFMNHLDFYSFFFPLQATVVLLIFPFLYQYVLSLTSEKPLLIKKQWYHYIFPALIFVTYMIFQKVLMTREEEIKFVKLLLDMIPAENQLFAIGKEIYDVGKLVFVGQGILYTFFIVRLVVRHYSRLKELFPTGGRNELTWFKALGVFFILMMVFYVIIHVLRNNQVGSNDLLISSAYFTFAGFIWFLGFNGFRQNEIFNLQIISEVSSFSTEVKISREQIEDFLLKEKPYTNPDVSVFDFCYHFHTNRTYMSEAISKGFGLNFRSLINQYRIRDAVDLMTKQSLEGLETEFEELAAKSGFSSYSTFLRVFKAETGLTPSEYLRQKLQSAKD